MKRILLVLVMLFLVTTSAAVAAPSPVNHQTPRLGVPHAFGPYSEGWGEARPRRLFNGGDPSGLVYRIHWATWGGKVARGHGLNPIFKPGGGYYAKPARIELKARNLGRCTAGGRLTYRALWYREPSRPGGPMGAWHRWAGYHADLCTVFD